MELFYGVPGGYDNKARSACCAAPIEHYHALSGDKFHRCQRCSNPTTPTGEPTQANRDAAPSGDLRAAFVAILSAFDWHQSFPHPTEAQAAAREREAFYWGARFRENVSNVTGDSFIRHEAERRYPTKLNDALTERSDK